MRVRGQVVKKLFATGSKSEHEAVMLVTRQGEFKLRREGGHPFTDPALDALVGHTIIAEGSARDRTFVMSSWKVESGQ